MELDWLQDFIVLTNLQSFSRAAEQRGITQPAFSRRIRALEQWIGADLFMRDTRIIALTPAGHKFKPIAEDLVRQLHLGRDQVRTTAKRSAEILRFGSTHVLSLAFLPDLLTRIEAESKNSSMISLITGGVPDCERLIGQGLISFMLYHHHLGEPNILVNGRYLSMDIGSDRLIPVSSPIGATSLEPLHTLPGTVERPTAYLEYSSDTGMARLLSHAFERQRWPIWLTTVFTSQNAVVLLAMVRAGRGLAWLPESLVKPFMTSRQLVRAGGVEWDLPMSVRISRPTRRQSDPAEQFWSLLRKVLSLARLDSQD